MEGGAGVLALRGARCLDRDDYAVTIISGSGERLLTEADAAGMETIVEPRLRSWIAPSEDVAAMRHLRALFAHRGFDVVHTQCAKAGAVGRIAAYRAGVRRIVHTYHGFPFHEFQTPLRRGAYLTVERRLGRITDLALGVGTGVSVEAIRRGLIAAHRVRTMGVAVDLDATARSPEARLRARRVLGLPPDGVVVGAVGRLTYQKAPEDFVTAVRVLGRDEVTGVWIGEGDRAAVAASECGIRFVGDRWDVTDLLPALDVFVLPSRYEGLPLAIVEAMVCGVPVVATAVNAVGDVVVPGETGLLVPPGRPDLLAAAVRYMLDSPCAAARMAVTARERVRARYGAHSLADVLTRAYSEGSGPCSHGW